MKRIKLVVGSGVVMVAMLIALSAPAMADTSIGGGGSLSLGSGGSHSSHNGGGIIVGGTNGGVDLDNDVDDVDNLIFISSVDSDFGDIEVADGEWWGFDLD